MPGLTFRDPDAAAALAAVPGLEALLDLTGDLAEPALRAAAGPPVTTARTRRLYRLELPGLTCYVKLQVAPPSALPPRRWLSYALRRPPHLREARALDRLDAAGFRVPEVLAAGARGRFPATVRAALVTRAVPDHVDLAAWLEAEPDPARRGAALDLAEALLAEVHAAGLALGGASPRNLLVPVDGPRAPRDLVLLDQPNLARASRHRCARDVRRLRRARGRVS